MSNPLILQCARAKKAKKMIRQFLFDYEVLKRWRFFSEIEKELEELTAKTKEIDSLARALNALRKTGRIRGRKREHKGFPIKVRFRCFECGEENDLSIIDFKDETWICTTRGVPRKPADY